MISTIAKFFTKVFGSRNERLIKAYVRRVEQINALEPQIRQLTDSQIRNRTSQFRQRIANGERVADLLPEIMAVSREVMDRAVGIRNILNPAHSFEVDQLSHDIRQLYEKVNEQSEAMEPETILGGDPIPGWMQVDIPLELYQAVRELYPTSRPPFRARPFDVQLIGGMVLGEGRIAEMKTGEGKTIVAPLACYVACLENLQCHVVTVNDYLVQRDRDWVFPFYYHLGLFVGAIHPIEHQTFPQPPHKKAESYQCDVVYGTNSEFGFDYLRDNMKLSVPEQVQGNRHFCIIDEVDSILIDEARTPLIISGPAHEDSPHYELADTIARHLMQKQREWDASDAKVKKCQMHVKGLEGDIRNTRDKKKLPEMREEIKRIEQDASDFEAQRDKNTQYYEVEMEKKASHLTHDGIAEAQKQAGIGSFYVGNNMEFPHLLENALRSHVVYQRDKDYVVQNGEVIIVDEFTGRLMIGRQWSEGLHQAVESKERVKIKQETQTLATVTIQNFFKLYKRLAGMTGTAITEVTEFNEIYKLDVICMPTNVPVIREDRNDLIYLSAKDKWDAILDEIKHIHDLGRPVLVGTTSVEKSEMLSQLLTKKHGIQHEVLNAKQHEREAHIVEHAGKLGAVMIATNMAGRGTDIKLEKIDRGELVRHWQQRNLLPKNASPDHNDDDLILMVYRHLANVRLGLREKELEGLDGEGTRFRLLRHWVETESFVDSSKSASMTVDQCLDLLDKVAELRLHRLEIYDRIEQMGGLHIVGTERHEARRIDNQLRGRSGRQGDRGSSRFFISLEDDLMQLFAGKTTMSALSKLGMKEGDAIEHRWITKSVERAQRKVEERNYEIRKNLLEYDEVMEYQRNTFYGIRQNVLEGNDIDNLIFNYLTESVEDAVTTCLDKEYVLTQIAEWCRPILDVSIEPGRLRSDALSGVQAQIKKEARAEVASVIDVTTGEYMSDDLPPEEWDLRGLSSWAMSRFSVDLKQNQLRQMNINEVKTQLADAAYEQIDRKDLSGVEKFLDPAYGYNDLVQWVQQKFGIEIDPKTLNGFNATEVSEKILQQARNAYRHREVTYPVDFILEMVFRTAQEDGTLAAEQLCHWTNQRFGLGWQTDQVTKMSGQELRDRLISENEDWLSGGKLEAAVDQAMATSSNGPASLADWASNRFSQSVTADELADQDGQRDVLIGKGRALLRSELVQLERFVLLQILDSSWKDHLYSMDQLKDSVGLRGYAEKDPRIEYKREGANQFVQMKKMVRDRVTELIFRTKLTADMETRSAYGSHQNASHADAKSLAGTASQAAELARRGTDEQRSDLDAADHAGSSSSDRNISRKQRRARTATEGKQKKQQQFKYRKNRKHH